MELQLERNGFGLFGLLNACFCFYDAIGLGSTVYAYQWSEFFLVRGALYNRKHNCLGSF